MSISLMSFVFLADQMTKKIVLQHFPLHSTRPLLDSFLYLTPTENRGSAFGLFQGSVPFFIASSLTAIAFMLLAARRLKMNFRAQLGFCILMGGAFGNLWDRVRHQYVVDFLDLKFWPVFNVADMAIVLGTCLLVVDFMRKKTSV